MAQIRVLNRQDIERVFTLDMAVQAVENAYRQKSSGEGSVWPMVFHEFVHGEADLDIKSGDLKTEEIFGLKVVSWYGNNPAQGLPELYGTALLFDRRTGAPTALLNAGPITGLRTGAAGAIGAKLLARPDSERLLMAGCGAQSAYLIAAALYAMPQLHTVRLSNPRSPAKAQERLPAIAEKVEALLQGCGAARDYTLTAAADLEQAVRESDVILTATPAYTPYIRVEWVQPGTHISCIGADMSGKQELDAEILAMARVFGDDEGQCRAVGECENAFRSGLLSGLTAEIGDVLRGTAEGRRNAQEITVFDSTGIALQDLASAARIVEAAEQASVGTLTEL